MLASIIAAAAALARDSRGVNERPCAQAQQIFTRICLWHERQSHADAAAAAAAAAAASHREGDIAACTQYRELEAEAEGQSVQEASCFTRVAEPNKCRATAQKNEEQIALALACFSLAFVCNHSGHCRCLSHRGERRAGMRGCPLGPCMQAVSRAEYAGTAEVEHAPSEQGSASIIIPTESCAQALDPGRQGQTQKRGGMVQTEKVTEAAVRGRN